MLTPTAVVILLAIALFVLGVVIGWVFSDTGDDDSTKAKLKIVVGLAVTIVWIAATVSDIFISAYTISPLLHALMGAIVGYFFTEDGITFNIGGDK